MKSRPSLRRQLVSYAVSLLAGSQLFVMAGTYTYLSIYEYLFYRALSPEAALAYARNWTELGMPKAELVEEISLAEERYLTVAYENEFTVMLALSVIALIAACVIAPLLSKRLTRPIETASASARTIADGEFAHVMHIPDHASEEVLSLSESFAHLTQSLRAMENDVRFTSASISHELRTPLTIIQGYLQGIRDGVFEANNDQLDLVISHTNALTRLVDDLKIVSLADAGELTLQRDHFRLTACLEEAVSFLRSQTKAKNIRLEVPETTAQVFADRDRIRQIVLAVLSNALRYGGDSVSCVTRYHVEGDTVHVQIIDDGRGFSTDALANATNRFWRGDSSRSRESGGSGLGLAVTHAIISAHNGELEIANMPEGGAIVTMKLPILSARKDCGQ